MSHTEYQTLPNFSATRDGLLPAVAQCAATGRVLMLAWMNAESFAETVRTGRAVYYSRSRGKLWRKGEESGNFQYIKRIAVDCDGDAILLTVDQVGGAACHEGYPGCFFREWNGEEWQTTQARVIDPSTLYGDKAGG